VSLLKQQTVNVIVATCARNVPDSGRINAMARKQRSGALDGLSEGVEHLLQRYLKERGWKYAWQQQLGSKVPDAVIYQQGKPIAVIEATAFLAREPSRHKPKEVAFIEEALEAFEEDEDKAVHFSELEPEDLAYSLMERLDKKHNLAKVAFEHQLPFLLAMYGGVLKGVVRYDLLQSYPEVSALGMLEQASLLMKVEQLLQSQEISSQLTEDDRRLIAMIENILRERWGCEFKNPSESFVRLEEFLKKFEGVPEEITKEEIVRMDILLNPHATYCWPETLIGAYDTVYRWNGEQQQWQLWRSGTTAILRRLATELLAGSVSVPWQEAISTSRSENFYDERDPEAHSA